MKKSTLEIVNECYEQFMFGGQRLDNDKIGFLNVGYWKGIEDSVELAQINLIETLVRFFSKRDGNVLDVACGKGASSKFLTKYFDANTITGINISERQLQICALIAPECEFRSMDATRLEFGDSSFDNILCIEAAFHFLTRQRFFEEAYRVLRPGGRLAMSDIIVHDYHLLGNLLHPDWPVETFPKENCLPSLAKYRDSLLGVGFKHARVEDSTDLSVNAWRSSHIKRAEREFDRKQDYKLLEGLMQAPSHGWTWCMVYAIK